MTESFSGLRRYEEERYYKDPKTNKKLPFPSLFENPCVTLSVIVPAYYEELRLPPMLNECLQHLEKKSKNEKGFTYEVIIVNDGSTDGTERVAMEYATKYGSDKIRLLNLLKNRGKGGAVRLGVLCARGEQILFADADGASKFEDVEKLLDATTQTTLEHARKDSMWKFPCVSCGSRAHLEKEAIATRSIFRVILMLGFHFLVWLLTVRGVRDTQCGFKLLSRSAARMVFPNLHIEGWAFDVELLYICQVLKIPINEVAVTWTEIEGSKITPVLSWIMMGIDISLIWLRYTTRTWKIHHKLD